MTSPNIAVVIVKKEGLVITVAVKAQAHLASQHELKATDPGSQFRLATGSGHHWQTVPPSLQQ